MSVRVAFVQVLVATLSGLTSAESSIVSADAFVIVPTHPTVIAHPVHDAPIVSFHSRSPQEMVVPDTIDSIATISLQFVNATVTFVFIVIVEVTPGKSGTISSKNSCEPNSAPISPGHIATLPIDPQRTHQMKFVILYDQQSISTFQTPLITP